MEFITADDDVLLCPRSYLLGLAVKLQRGYLDLGSYTTATSITRHGRTDWASPFQATSRIDTEKWPDELIFISGNFKQLPNVFAGKRISVIP